MKLPTKRDMVSILGKDFFNEEIRCDYLVTEKMKKIWAVNMDLYLEFAQICKKYDLTYYAYAGTMLGAIRHNGFIPWDDDMDVCMPRVDYELFLEVAPKELSEPYKLQTPFTEPGYFRTVTRLSNILTTRMLSFFRHSGMSHGLILDIFPLDNCNPETNKQEIDEILIHAKRCAQFLKRNDTEIMTPDHFARWKEYMTDDPMGEWEKVQQVAKKWQNSNTDYLNMKVCVSSDWISFNMPLKKEWFSPIRKVKFENIEVPVPSDAESVLTVQYGDFMKYPPKEKRGSWHQGLIIDPERPYTDYL